MKVKVEEAIRKIPASALPEEALARQAATRRTK
jgi:hypothetical protein